MEVEMPKVRRTLYTVVIKRFFDVVFSGVAMIALCPVYLTIAILVWLFLGRPIIFSQERIGLHKKVFKIYKFRSMTNEVDENGELLPGAQRLTSFGRFLRRFSLDELPELFCIFSGKMSIIGPRPLLPEYLPYYSARHSVRHEVKPGLACLPLQAVTSWTWNDQFENDVWYTENCSFFVDLKMMFVVAKAAVLGAQYRTDDTRATFDEYNPAYKKVTNQQERQGDNAMKILVIAPHPDDEVLGVGGTIAKYASQGDEVYVAVVTKGCEPLFSAESVEKVRTECVKADKLLGVKKTVFMDFPAVMLETVPRYKLNQAFIDLMQDIAPDEVYIPHRGDMQLDHKMVVDAAMVALRPKYSYVPRRIYAYETLSETGWDVPNALSDFIPTVYQDISNVLDKKRDALKIYATQLQSYPNARSKEAVEALARYRGATVGVCAAEAFALIREIR